MSKYISILIGLFLLGNAFALPIGVKDVPVATHPPIEKANEFYQKGLEALVNNNLLKAEQAFNQSLEIYPDAANAILGLAEVEFNRGALTKAKSLLDKALIVEPRNAHIHMTLGRYFRLQKLHKRAMDSFQKTIQLDNNFAVAYVAIGDLHLMVFNEPSKAIDNYKKAIVIDPQNAASHYALGIAFHKNKDDINATQELEKSAQLDKTNPLPYIETARIYQAQGKADNALQYAEKAIERQPNSLSGNLLYADILVRLGRVNDAEREYLKLIKANEKGPVPRESLAMLYQQLGKLDKAEKYYRSVISLRKSSALSSNNLAWLLAGKEKTLEEALGFAQNAVMLRPENADYYDTLGSIQQKLGALKEACKNLSKAVSLDPGSASIHERWAMYCK